MKPSDRQKMCSNCDARIPLSAKECPFCGAECAEAVPSPAEGSLYKHQNLQDSLTALYPPPYSSAAKPVSGSSTRQEESVKVASLPQEARVEKKPVTKPAVSASPHISLPAEEEEEKNTFWPIFMLSGGALLLTLGLLQFFFSDQGVLRLEWDSTYWLLYCFASAPLLYFGYKKAGQLK